MTTIAIVGAGGKMGIRLTDNLIRGNYELLVVEPSQTARDRLTERDLTAVPLEAAAATADVVILAVPDNRIGEVARETVSHMKSGASLIVLDAAAPAAGHLPTRDDVSFLACHPCHPSVFNRDETERIAQRDFFGGVAGRQDVVIALISGDDEDFERAERVIRDSFAPVLDTHRVTIENMVLLEPVLSETVAATCIVVIEEAMREVIQRGVPADAARAFILGHLGIELAVVFGEVDSPFSDGALKAIESAKTQIFRDDWKQVFESDAVAASVADIVA